MKSNRLIEREKNLETDLQNSKEDILRGQLGNRTTNDPHAGALKPISSNRTHNSKQMFKSEHAVRTSGPIKLRVDSLDPDDFDTKDKTMTGFTQTPYNPTQTVKKLRATNPVLPPT